MDKKTHAAGTRIRGAAERIREFVRRYVSVPGEAPEDRRAQIRARLAGPAKGVLCGFAAFMFARASLPFAVTPFGAALMCATGIYTPFAYIGLCVSSIFAPAPLAYFLTYTLGFLIRIAGGLFFSPGGGRIFDEKQGLRILAAAVMAFTLGVYRTAAGGFLFYDLFGCFLGLAVTPAAVPVFGIALERGATATGLRDACIAAITAVGVWSLSGITAAGFSVASVAAFIVTLYVSRECGSLRAGVVGLLCGLTIGLQWAPLYALAGLVAGLFWRVSSLAATAAAVGVGMFYSVWADSSASFISMAPDLLCASVIFAPLAHFGLLPSIPLYGGSRASAATGKTELYRRGRDGINSRFEAIQKAFASIADVLGRMSDKTSRPTSAQTRERCEAIFTGYCENCARHTECWDRNCDDTGKAVATAAQRIARDGRVTLSDMPNGFLRRCFRAETVINELNSDYSLRLERIIKENKTEVRAEDYEAVSRLIGEALEAAADEFTPDERLTRKLAGCAGYLDLPVSAVSCYGTRKKTIVAGGVDLSRVRAGAEDIRRSFEKVCGFPLSPPEFSVERGSVTMKITSRPRFRAYYARAGSCREGEEINGDSVNFFENDRDYFYALLSDGMGSGREAALTSRLCGVFLDKMLRAGNSKATALDMLNSLIRGKGVECFATIDLFEFDLMSGEACFVKSGAAPSYVLRGDSVFRIESGTYPLGIIKEASSEQVSLTLRDGDVVVLLSDGVASNMDEALWVVDMLTCDCRAGESLASMCERIVTGARSRGRGDDASCAMIRVKAA